MGMLWPVALGVACGVWRAPCHSSGVTRQPSRSTLLWIWPLGFGIFFLLALILSFSRGAWLGAAAAGVTFLAFLPRRPWIGIGLVAVALIGGGLWLAERGRLPSAIASRAADLTDFARVADARGQRINDANYAVLQRLAFWQAAAAMAETRPWLGVGLGNYPAAYPRFALLNWPQAIGHAHNIYLNMLAEVGVFGLGAYLLFWANVIALTLRALRTQAGWRRGLALGLLAVWGHIAVHGIVDNLYVNNLHLFIGAFIGIVSVRRKGI